MAGAIKSRAAHASRAQKHVDGGFVLADQCTFFFVLMRYTSNFDGSDEHMNAIRRPPLVVPSGVA